MKCWIAIIFIGLTACTPRPADTDWLRENNLPGDIAYIFQEVELPDTALTLDEIIEIALCRNLDLLVKEQEYAIQRETATREKFKMLPRLMANGELSGRDKPLIVSSESVDPTVPPAPPSISQEQHVERLDLTLVFNLLDFGLSYLHTKQELNRAQIKEMEYARIKQNLVLDIVKQYWQAAVAKEALDSAKEVFSLAQERRRAIQSNLKDRLITTVDGRTEEAKILDIEYQLQAYEKSYHSAISALGQLMALPPHLAFDIDVEENEMMEVNLDPIEEIETFALYHRPELYARDLDEIVEADEARAAFIQMLPGVELFGGKFYDGNFFLRHRNWAEAGARATWNLLSIPQHKSNTKAALKRQELMHLNRLALTMGVISQVRLAAIVFLDHRAEYKRMKQKESAYERVLDAIQLETELGKRKKADLIPSTFDTITARVDAVKAYGEMQIALEQLNNAMGHPRYFKTSSAGKPQ